MENVLGVPLGWAGGTGLTSVDAVRAEARYAAEGGFDAFWVSQIFGVDPMVALAAVIPELDGVAEIGTSVVPLFGRNPLALAAQALTVQSALDGRFTLGIGPSHAIFVEGFFGEKYDRPYTHTSEYVEALLPLLAGEPVDVEGDRVFAKGWLNIEAPPVPLLLAAMGTRMLQLAGRTSAGTMLGFPVGAKTIAEHIAPVINDAAAEAGREQPAIWASVSVAITDDPKAARAVSLEQGAMYSDLPAYRAMLDREGVESPADLLVAGSADQVIEGLAGYVAAGATALRLGVGGANEAERDATRAALPGMLNT